MEQEALIQDLPLVCQSTDSRLGILILEHACLCPLKTAMMPMLIHRLKETVFLEDKSTWHGSILHHPSGSIIFVTPVADSRAILGLSCFDVFCHLPVLLLW
jgi:hypothetical protein